MNDVCSSRTRAKKRQKKVLELQRREADESAGLRLEKYERVLRLFNIQGAALLGQVTIYAAVSFGETTTYISSLLGAIFLTVVLLSAALLAHSRGLIEWQADLLRRYVRRGEGVRLPEAVLEPTTKMEEVPAELRDRGVSVSWPKRERSYRKLGQLAMLVAGVLLLLWVWLPVIEPHVVCDMPPDDAAPGTLAAAGYVGRPIGSS